MNRKGGRVVGGRGKVGKGLKRKKVKAAVFDLK